MCRLGKALYTVFQRPTYLSAVEDTSQTRVQVPLEQRYFVGTSDPFGVISGPGDRPLFDLRLRPYRQESTALQNPAPNNVFGPNPSALNQKKENLKNLKRCVHGEHMSIRKLNLKRIPMNRTQSRQAPKQGTSRREPLEESVNLAEPLQYRVFRRTFKPWTIEAGISIITPMRIPFLGTSNSASFSKSQVIPSP